jgi:hypothetical protein
LCFARAHARLLIVSAKLMRAYPWPRSFVSAAPSGTAVEYCRRAVSVEREISVADSETQRARYRSSDTDTKFAGSQHRATLVQIRFLQRIPPLILAVKHYGDAKGSF